MILQGDSREVLKTFPDNHFHAIITDPPYALTNRVIDGARCSCGWEGTGNKRFLKGSCPKCGKEIIRERLYRGNGFMGKSWDNGEVAFDWHFWAECLRVLRPGGYLLSFGGSRTYHRMACAIEDAGFEIRDCINWVYGSGFPKSLSIDKAFDKDNEAEREVICRNPNDREQNSSIDFNGKGNGWISDPASDEAKQWNGWGTALKPAHEPIVMARKPLDGRVIDNIRAWGVGGINVDGCRIKSTDFDPKERLGATKLMEERPWNREQLQTGDRKTIIEGNSLGRFPSNLILSHSPNCVKVGRKKIKPLEGHRPNPVNVQSDGNIQFNCKEPGFQKVSYTDASGHETIDDYVCAEDCPIRLMGEQSGISRSVHSENRNGSNAPSLLQKGFEGKSVSISGGHNDTGTAARFFLNIDPEPFFYCAKASRSEREHGLGEMPAKEAQKNGGGARLGRDTSLDKRLSENGTERILLKNFHPTVKPLKLMRYLCRLITPPRGLILDPFAGSGTTLCAAKLEGFDATGIELNQEYITIAEARLAAYSDLHKPLTSFS